MIDQWSIADLAGMAEMARKQRVYWEQRGNKPARLAAAIEEEQRLLKRLDAARTARDQEKVAIATREAG